MFYSIKILHEAIAAFSAAYPGIRLELVKASSAFLADMLSERLIDITFSCRDDLIANFENTPAFTDHILLAVSSEILNLDCGLSAYEVLD